MLKNTNRIWKYINIISVMSSIGFTIIIFFIVAVIKNTVLTMTEENADIISIILSFVPLLPVFVFALIIIKINRIINSYSLQYQRDIKYFQEVECTSKEKLEKSNYDNLLLKNQIRTYEKNALEHKREIEYLNTKILTLKDQVLQLESSLEISRKKEDIREDVEQLNNMILALNEEKASLTLLLESQKQLLEKDKLENELKNNNIKELEQKLDVEKAIHTNMEATIENLKIEIQKNEMTIEKLDKEKQATYIKENLSATAKIEKLKTSYNEANQEIKELKNTMRLKNKEIKILNKKVSLANKNKESVLSGVIEKNKKEKDSKIRKVLQDKDAGYNLPFEKVFWDEQEENEEV